MGDELTSTIHLETLRKEAKRWLKSIRADDADAIARLRRAYPEAPVRPGLRDVQHALAREPGFDGWRSLKASLVRASTGGSPLSREHAITVLLRAAVARPRLYSGQP